MPSPTAVATGVGMAEDTEVIPAVTAATVAIPTVAIQRIVAGGMPLAVIAGMSSARAMVRCTARTL